MLRLSKDLVEHIVHENLGMRMLGLGFKFSSYPLCPLKLISCSILKRMGSEMFEFKTLRCLLKKRLIIPKKYYLKSGHGHGRGKYVI